MLAKSIIAGTVLSLMAGGVVYFGTDVDTTAVKDKVIEKTSKVKAEISDKVMSNGDKKHPHGAEADSVKQQDSTDTPSVKTASGTVIEAKKPTISYASNSEDKKIKTVEVVSPEKPQKKWLDQYLKEDTKDENIGVVEDGIEAGDSKDVAKDLLESMGLTKDESSDEDTASFVVEDDNQDLTEEQILQAEAEGFEERAMETENIWVEEEKPDETGRKKATRKMLHDIIKKDRAIFIGEGSDGEERNVEVKVIANEDGKTTIETETIDMGDGKIMKIVKKTVKSESHDSEAHDENHKKMRIKVMSDEEGKDGIRIITVDKHGTKSKDISSTVKVVMEQAEMIKMPELRDRAYLDLVSYGLDHGDYKVAAKALTKIEQVELRDTARNRIAVAHAKAGDAKNAFDILEDIEVDALRDVMRLQVIEAMIAPNALPEDMQ